MKCIGNVIKKINMERRRWLVYNSNVFFVSMSIAVGIKYVSCFINFYHNICVFSTESVLRELRVHLCQRPLYKIRIQTETKGKL